MEGVRIGFEGARRAVTLMVAPGGEREAYGAGMGTGKREPRDSFTNAG